MERKPRLILEFTEFNLQRMNSDDGNVSIGLAPNRSLSVNTFDKHQDALRSGLSRINTIMKSLTNSSAYKSLKSRLSFQDQIPSKLKILRIIPNNVDYYVYIEFEINEKVYDGCIKNILRSPKLSTNVFKDDRLVQSEEWKIKLEGLLIKTMKKFLDIPSGEYKLLKEEISCNNMITGEEIILREGEKINVIKTLIRENKIIIEYKSNRYSLVKDNFIYFNYWFIRI